MLPKFAAISRWRRRDPVYAFVVGSILLVEADPETCDRWSDALGTAGHAVFAVAAMRDALELIREGGIEVVVIDAYDSCAGVVELARSMQALPDAPPVVLVSSSPLAPEISVRISAAQFLPKPCEPFEVVDAVHQLSAHRPVLVLEDDEATGPNRYFV